MKKNILLIAFLLLALPVFADQCLTSVDGTSSVTTNVTTGTSVQLSVTPSGSCSSGEATLQLTYSNCSLTITDPASPGYYSGVSTGSAKTFTVTSGSTGVCTVTARGSTSDGSVDDNSPVILEFIDPSVLTINAAPSSASVVHGSSFGLGINITNPQSADITTSYVLTLPSELTKTAGDLTTNPSIIADGGGVKNLQWTITHSTCFTGTKTITFQLADNSNAFAVSVSGNSSCGSSSSSNSSSGSGAGAGAGANLTSKETKLVSTAAETSVILAFTQVTSPGITQIEIKTTTAKPGISISLAPATNPSGAPDILSSADGKVYSYANISKENVQDSDFSLIKIKFKVPTVWMSANAIDYTKIYMYRYVGSTWTRLTTTFKSNDSTNYFYEATSPGFSTFAVAGYKPAATVPTSTTISAPSIGIIAPASGQKISSSSVNVQMSVSGVTLAEPKTTYVSGEGHFHLWLDDASEQEGPQTTFTYDNVSEGNHTIRVELRTSNRSSFNPPVTSAVTFAVGSASVQAPPPTFNVDITVIAIGVVLLGVIGAGVYFGFMRGDAKASKIASRMPKHSSKPKPAPSPSARVPRDFGRNVADSVVSIAGGVGGGLQALFEKLPKKSAAKPPEGSFSTSYEFRGEVNYQSYSPDAVEASAKKEDDKTSADSGAAPSGATGDSGPVSA